MIEQRSAVFRHAFESLPSATAPSEDATVRRADFYAELKPFFVEALDQSRFVLSPADRTVVREILEGWASVLYTEFDDDDALLPMPQPADIRSWTPQEIGPERLLALLEANEVVHQKLIRNQGAEKSRMETALEQGMFVDCRFERFDFSGYQIRSEADLVGVAFVECKLRQLVWNGLRAASLLFKDISDFSDSRFPNSSFADVGFRSITCADGSFHNARFVHCLFEDTDFVDTNFTGAIFSRCAFVRCSFIGCKLDQVSFYDSDLEGTTFAGGEIEDTLFSGCELHGLQLMERRQPRLKARKTTLHNLRVRSSFGVPEEWELEDVYGEEESPLAVATPTTSVIDK